MQRGAAVATLVSVLLHGGAGWGLHVLRTDRPPPKVDVKITVVTVDKPAPVKPVEPPPPPKPAPAVKRHTAPKPVPAPVAAAPKAAPPPPAAAPAPPPLVPALGVPLTNGAKGGSMSVAQGRPDGEAGGTGMKERVLEAEPEPAAKPSCTEAVVRPKPLETPQPAYPEEARAASIEGKVRVEVTVGADGRVSAARVVEGPGHGLDDAALDVVKTWTFQPASRCGIAEPITFVLAVRFSL